MRTSSSILFGTGLTALLVGMLAACSSSDSGTSGAAGGGGSAGSGVDAGKDSGTTTDGGTGEAGNDASDGAVASTDCPASPADAVELQFADADAGIYATPGTMPDPTTSECWYKFTGTKDQVVQLISIAKPSTDPFNTSYLDTVVTLYDANQNQLARNDDPTPRVTNDAQVFTKLPSSGTYYLKLQECNGAFGANSCADAAQITDTTFQIAVALPTQEYTSEGAEPDDDGAHATAIPNTPVTGQAGSYYIQYIGGTFASASDIDVYKVDIPSDLTVPTGSRAALSLDAFPSGTDGDGATTPIGPVWIVESTDSTNVIAKLDVSTQVLQGSESAEISLPVSTGKTYWAYVQHPTGSAGSADFYFAATLLAYGNPVEAETTPGTNDTIGGAQGLTASSNAPTDFYVEGDLPDGDVDFFTVAVPTSGLTNNTVGATCGAATSGSGVRGLQVSLLKSDGATALGANSSATESATTSAQVAAMAFGTETTIAVKIEATQPADTSVTGRYYRCAVFFQ